MSTIETFRQNFIYLRSLSGWDQNEMAERANIAQGTVCKIEKGTMDPCLDIIDQIAFAFGVTTLMILCENQEDFLVNVICDKCGRLFGWEQTETHCDESCEGGKK